jgi:glycosyltransferase involved in cell wall biosynthesis
MATDWFVKPGSWQDRLAGLIASVRPAMGNRLRSRRADALNDARILMKPSLVLRHRRAKHGSAFDGYAAASRRVTQWLLNADLDDANTLYGYVRNLDPALCVALQQRGWATLADQIIAPAIIERRELAAQQQRFAGWQQEESLDDLDRYATWEQATWDGLHHITCMSDYVRDGLIEVGVDASRISVLPYAMDVSRMTPAVHEAKAGPLTVVFVGAVSLRKGVPYVFDVARRLSSRAVRFVLLGPVLLSDKALAEKPANVALLGRQPRDEVLRHLRQSDVFLFPSTCEGSAGAVVEAMACGLPVVISPNSGSFARDGVEGYIAAYDDVDALADRVATLLDDVTLRQQMGAAARARVEHFSIASYAEAIGRVVRDTFASVNDTRRG